MIRHQNPYMNRPGVKPAPPPRQIHAVAATVAALKPTKTQKPDGFVCKTIARIELTCNKKTMRARDRPDDEKPLKSKIPVPAPPRPARRPGDSLGHPCVVDDIPAVVIRIPSTPPPPPAAPTAKKFPDRDAKLTTAIISSPPCAPTKRKFSERDGKSMTAATNKRHATNPNILDLSRLRPTLPYRRRHYIRRLGEGGEGHCDLFRLHSPHTLLVIKTFKETPQLIWLTPSEQKPLEAYIMQDILVPHPRILKLHDYVHTKRTTMLFYEFCEYNTLQEVTENYWAHGIKVPEAFVWHVFCQLAEALAFIHTGHSTIGDVASIGGCKNFTPITHRDIKPENIFLRRPVEGSCMPDVALADWGLATHLSGNTNQDYAVGTPSFQGPEVPRQTREGDLWALGAVVHCLCHGWPPIASRPAGVSEEAWLGDGRSREVTSPGNKGGGP
ncbi:MAG: hypothetical protein Q9183_007164 [Haloplaca sp. 2 TL-2023]